MTARAVSSDFLETKESWIYSIQVLAWQLIYKWSPIFADATSWYWQTNDGTTITIANWDIFLWIAYELIDNSAWSSWDEDIRYTYNGNWLLPISDGSMAQWNIWDNVYVNNVSDDSTFTVTSDTWNPQVTIWVIVKIEDADNVWVKLTWNPIIAANWA